MKLINTKQERVELVEWVIKTAGGILRMNSKYAPLFEPFTFSNGVQIKNRLVMAPMTNFSSNPDGTVTDAEVTYYARRSSGVGMVITACTYVTANGKGFHGEFGGDRDELIPELRQWQLRLKKREQKQFCKFSM